MRVVETETFVSWLARLRDVAGRRAILSRIARLAATANFGDWASVGDGVSEMRVHAGPGYRVYFTERDGVWVILLCGGDKDSQSRDIARAKRLASTL